MVGRGHYLAEIEGVEGILLEEESLVLDKGRERQADSQEPAQILDRQKRLESKSPEGIDRMMVLLQRQEKALLLAIKDDAVEWSVCL